MAEPTTSGAGTASRLVVTGLWVLQVLIAATLAYAAFRKLGSLPDSVELFGRIGLGQWLRYAVGLLEAALVIALLVPRLAGAAALGTVVVMIGATATEVALSTGRWLLPLVVLVAAAVVAWGRRESIAALLPRH